MHERGEYAGAVDGSGFLLLLACAATWSCGAGSKSTVPDSQPAGGGSGGTGMGGALGPEAARYDADPDGPTWMPAAGSGGTEADDVSGAGVASSDADRDVPMGALPDDAGSGPSADLSVAQVLGSASTLRDTQLTVVGKVFEDIRQKPGDWPAPALSTFIMQDGGDAPAYAGGGSSGIPYIQLHASSDLGPFLHQNVRIRAILRSVLLQSPGGSSSFLYLEVTTISTL